jgi:outer membrane protein OmpA-like peptidoglycan-associated protein
MVAEADLSSARERRTQFMKLRLVFFAVIAAFTTAVAAPAAAAPTEGPHGGTRSMGVGLAAGALLGAIVGGPPGAIAGMALGGISTDRMLIARQSGTLELHARSLEGERHSLLAERQSLAARVDELSFLLAQERDLGASATDVAMLAQGLEFAVGFRTNSATPATDAGEGFAALASLVNAVPSLDVHLDGYADPRGSEQLNRDLSRARADTIRDRLVDAGVDPGRIHVKAHGATASDSAEPVVDPDGWALQRRVNIRLELREGWLASKH